MFPNYFTIFATGIFLIYIEIAAQALGSQNEVGHGQIFDLDLKTQFAKVNTNYKMKCMVKVPALTFWTVDGRVPDGVKFKILSDSNLVVANISRDDFNREYLCHAIIPGKQNVDSMQIHLGPFDTTNREGRMINTGNSTTKSKIIFALVGSEKTLSCSATARPYPDFKWLHENGTLIQDKSDFTISTNSEDVSNLTILLRNVDYYGEYICEAWNNLGRTAQSFQLKMPQKPLHIPFVYPKSIGARKLVLGVEYDKTHNYTVHVQYKRENETLWSSTLRDHIVSPETVEILSLEPNTKYHIRVALRGEYVLGDYSDIILVTTDKDISVSDPSRARNLQFDAQNEYNTLVEKVGSSKTLTSKVISRKGNKTVITTNSSTVEEIYDEHQLHKRQMH